MSAGNSSIVDLRRASAAASAAACRCSRLRAAARAIANARARARRPALAIEIRYVLNQICLISLSLVGGRSRYDKRANFARSSRAVRYLLAWSGSHNARRKNDA